MSTAANVSAGKPKIGGAIYTAPVGTPLPTNAIDPLDPAFRGLGYVSEDGLRNDNSPESDTVKAWGGDTVLVIQSSKEDTFKFTLIEVKNINVLRFMYGSGNVEGDLATGIKVTCNNNDVEEVSIVIDMIMSDNTAKRVVIPTAKISDVGDLVYSDSDAVGYETTVDCIPDLDGNTHYEYILKPTISA